jgi:HopA1 effector protein family
MSKSSGAVNMSDFIAVLAEIIDRIEIHPDLTLAHSNYPPLSPVPQVAARIKHAPRDIQAKYIAEKLSAYLATIYFDRSLSPVSADSQNDPSSIAPTLVNNTSSGFNTVFYNQLVAANRGDGYYDPDWVVESIPCSNHQMDTIVGVVKEGLHLHQPQLKIDVPSQTFTIGDRVSILLPKNIVTRSRYIAIGNRGRVNSDSIVNIYFNVPTTTILDLTTQLTIDLNQLNLAFELHIDPNPDRHGRCEPIILSLAKSDYSSAFPALIKIYHSIAHTCRNSVPFSTKLLAPGIAIGEVYSTNEDDGNHHCGAIAYALAQAWMSEITNSDTKLDAILATLLDSGIDSHQPYLIMTDRSPTIDIYQSID